MNPEDLITERVDADGHSWRKLYVGSGAHFNNWLEQFIEICGADRIEVEEADPTGFKCYEEGKETMYRVWVRND